MVDPGTEGEVTAENKPEEVEDKSQKAADKPVKTETDSSAPTEDVPDASTETDSESALAAKSSGFRFAVFAIVIVLGVLGYFLVSHNNSGAGDLTKIQGNVALSEQELRDAVSANHLTAYWVGPVAGDKYTLLATNPNQIYIKYLPAGVGANDTKTSLRVVGTYVKKSAFQVGQYTGSLPGNVGLINGDGNSVFYASSRTTNVYLGLKGKDIQIEVYDPVAGQSLGLALMKNQVQQIS